ncbi:hypothetical protein ACV229_38175 [Burkholderia sp. MR1-5-21]
MTADVHTPIFFGIFFRFIQAIWSFFRIAMHSIFLPDNWRHHFKTEIEMKAKINLTEACFFRECSGIGE